MVKCVLCGKQCKRGAGSFFRVPSCDSLRAEWSKSCQVELKPKSMICSDHFARSDMVVLGQQKRLLNKALPMPPKPSTTNSGTAVPSVQPNTASNSTNTKLGTSTVAGPTTQIQYPWYTPELLSNIYVATRLSEKDTKKDEMINAALFDNADNANEPYITVNDVDNSTNPLFDPIGIKTEEFAIKSSTINDFIIDPSKFPITQGSQTDESSEDRINCGFVNVSKNGPNKYFNLRCFYCDAEFPISFWSEFSEHILFKHNDLEKKYNMINDKLISTTIDQNNTNDSDEMPELQLQQQYVLRNKCELKIEHNYSQLDLNQPTNDGELNTDDESTDKITFNDSSRDIILDLLNNIKGYPSLWRDRTLSPINYDRELQALMDIMTIKWNLNLTIDGLRKNWENIRDWYNNMRAAREMYDVNNIQHTFSEYYDICEEFLLFGGKNNKKCDRCIHIAINTSLLQVHKYSKHKIGLPPYKCHKCNKTFVYIDYMLKHLRKHVADENKVVEENTSTETEFKCFVCEQIFHSTYEYKLHLDIHPNGDRPYGCEDCGNRFKDRTRLKTHQKQHKIEEYQCQLCPAKFKGSFRFKNHMKAHKGIYEYVCEWCGRPFVARNRWWIHVKYEHMGGGLCKICNREYKKPSILQKHLKNLHRPLFGTNEELSIRGRRKGSTSSKGFKRRVGPNLNARKYEYIIDPVTKMQRLKCPKCEESFRKHETVIKHALQIHNYDIRKVSRGKWRKTVKDKLLKNVSASDTNAATTAAAVDTITNYTDNALEENETQVATDIKESSFEKLVVEITSPDDGLSQCSTDEYQFILNTNGAIVNFPDYAQNK